MLKATAIGFAMLAVGSLLIPSMMWFQNPSMTAMEMYAVLHTDIHLSWGMLGCALGFWAVDSRLP